MSSVSCFQRQNSPAVMRSFGPIASRRYAACFSSGTRSRPLREKTPSGRLEKDSARTMRQASTAVERSELSWVTLTPLDDTAASAP